MSTDAEQRAFTGFWQRRVVAPIVAQLKQGITPEKIALTLALGAVLGIFPILGSTTLLCALAGMWLRLNQPVIQLVNYFVYPAQVALLLPFYRAGESLFGQPHVPIFSVTELMQRYGLLGWIAAQIFNPNAGYILMVTIVGQYLIYETFHYCCHVKDNAFVRNMPFINTIRRHHTAHHNQGIMMHYNMNLTFPIADWFMGTSDLDRGLVGTIFNGYNEDHVKPELKPMIEKLASSSGRSFVSSRIWSAYIAVYSVVA